MKKQILLLLTIIVLLLTPSMNVSAAVAEVAKPTVTHVKSTPGRTLLSVKCTTKGATIYYTNDGTKPTTKSKSVKSGQTIDIQTTKLSKVRVIAYANKKYSAVAYAPKVTVTAKPTYKVEVTNNGKVKITINTTTKNARIYYTFKSSDTIDYKSKSIKAGETIVVDYKDADRIYFRAYANKSYSVIVDFSVGVHADNKYLSMVKEIVSRETKGLATPEDKLMALWDWTMANTDYARTSTGKADSKYHHPQNLIFEEKAVCQGFAYLWKEMAKLAGFETNVIIDRKANHAYCVTKVNSKWFYVDTTHAGRNSSTTLSGSYDKFLNNEYANHSSNFHGFDCSSDRYFLEFDNGNTAHYFDLLDNANDGDGYFTYNSDMDKYSFNWYD